MLFPAPDIIPSLAQNFSSLAENSLGQALLSPSESSNSLPELPCGQVKVHLNILPGLLSHLGFCLSSCSSSSPSGYWLPLCCFRRSPSSAWWLLSAPVSTRGFSLCRHGRSLLTAALSSYIYNGGFEHSSLRFHVLHILCGCVTWTEASARAS